MKHVLTILSVVLFSWLLAGAPLSFIKVAPLPVNHEAPKFNDTANDVEVAYHESTDDVQYHFDLLKEDPCSKALKKNYIQSLKPFFRFLRNAIGGSDRVWEDGKKFRAITYIFEESYSEGYIQKKDLPLGVRWIFFRAEWDYERACEVERG